MHCQIFSDKKQPLTIEMIGIVRLKLFPAYAGRHGCPSSAVVYYGGQIKPWGSTTTSLH
jgi:hypothetical protein